MLMEQEKLGGMADPSERWNEQDEKPDICSKPIAVNRTQAESDSNRVHSQMEAQCQSYNSASEGSQLNSLTQLSASETEGATNCGKASFIAKLCEMLNDDASEGLVRWGVEGRSIVVTDPNGFAQVMLPRCFRLQDDQSKNSRRTSYTNIGLSIVLDRGDKNFAALVEI